MCENLYLLAQQKTNEIIMNYCSPRALCAISATICSEMFNERQCLLILFISLGRPLFIDFQPCLNDDGSEKYCKRENFNSELFQLSFRSLGSNTMRKSITKQKATTHPLGNFLIRTFEFYGRFFFFTFSFANLANVRKAEEEKKKLQERTKSVSKSPAKLKGSILLLHNEAGERKKAANMQKRPRETYKIPVKSRSAQNECVLNLKNEMEKKTLKISHKNRLESRVNHRNELRLVNCLKCGSQMNVDGHKKKMMN